MDREKLDEVSKILEIDSSEVIYSRRQIFYRRLIFSIIQAGFYLLSSLLGVVFGRWESAHSTYPHSGVQITYTWGTLTLFGIGSANLALSFATGKRLMKDRILMTFIVLLNLTLSIVSFFLIFKDVYTPLSAVILYNVFEKDNCDG